MNRYLPGWELSGIGPDQYADEAVLAVQALLRPLDQRSVLLLIGQLLFWNENRPVPD